ncbi:hypothetical protein BX616_009866 [Lobosporangium transversale]|uniref:Anaphase-promoting complex subunit 13 n=1 Tax=Lobosporangium transversale TaxID=64571 RepID=A0A1Y2GXG7_9FUNG|nr:hypothetical protein BCR41DRAFT_393003 [Lobosporangium transversale]KAF9913568.1 hypothetical protein BX616_009866 [Lobosporangium transversale]ORZ26976.1 hypothetical protein BCR41DRAFT_393003 [Lobosporangium transversale]|eukprot:XP_021884723.1 hypothetical protein BCR41DRAFT_393003 [Lobosporangium transversale]
MSDSQVCHVHWRDKDLINNETEWEMEDLPDDDIMVPLNEQPASAEESEQVYDQEMQQMEQKWTDQDLPTISDTENSHN